MLCLQFPVFTVSGRLLLPVGTRLTPEVMEPLFDNNRHGEQYESKSLLFHNRLVDDLFLQIHTAEHYKVIFSDTAQIERMMKILVHVELPIPIISYLEYFKLNDFATYRHILLVFALSMYLAVDLIDDTDQIIAEAIAGPTHDFGKLTTPLQILTKATPLTQLEKAHLEHHTLSGYVLLSYYFPETMQLPALVALQHHERCNGSGYPLGIPISNLLIEIVAACDIYDALISPRPYRPVSYNNRAALEIVTRMAEKGELGWNVVRALVARNRRNQPHYTECEISLDKRGVAPSGNLYGIFQNES